MAVNLLFVHALTSIHAGTGQGVGAIDLPIARERATNLPVIFGSMLKGCLKANKQRPLDRDKKDLAYGLADKQGKLRVSDARLLLLPVRCPGSTFVWTTSPYILRRFQRDCALLTDTPAPEVIPVPDDNSAYLAEKGSAVDIGGVPKLVLEDLDLDIRQENGSREWAGWIANRLFRASESAWIDEFHKRFAILSDANFNYFCEFATEVNAHVRIGESGTVEPGALWYEETLPAETVLVAIVEDGGDVRFSDVVPDFLRLGGNETTGHGLARLAYSGGAA